MPSWLGTRGAVWPALPALPALDLAALLECVDRDKKALHDGAVWVLPTELGAWEAVQIPPAEVREALAAFVVNPGAC